MADIKEQINLYFQRLLKLQFELSDLISHKVTKGKLREEFIKNVIHKIYPDLKLSSGILYDKHWQSSECDFIWLIKDAQMGTEKLYRLNDTLMFMEIKSCTKSSEFQKLNQTAFKIKTHSSKKSNILVGIFCYSTKSQQQTVCRHFGINYDKEIKGYEKYNRDLDKYKNIDFCLCLNCKDKNDTAYYITRDISRNCILYIRNPVLELFLNNFEKYF